MTLEEHCAHFLDDQRKTLGPLFPAYAKRCADHWTQHYGPDFVQRVRKEYRCLTKDKKR